MFPFEYPTKPLRRRHGPVYHAYETYRPWLRDEFSFRCVYCLKREQWGVVLAEWDLDHYIPQAIGTFASKVDYDNLVYACHTCNVAKGKRRIPDPTKVLLRKNLIVHPNGRLQGLKRDAKRIIQTVGLDSSEYRRLREMWIGISELALQHDFNRFIQLMGFPQSLPNLARKKPKMNHRPSGFDRSYFAIRSAGKLPTIY